MLIRQVREEGRSKPPSWVRSDVISLLSEEGEKALLPEFDGSLSQHGAQRQ